MQETKTEEKTETKAAPKEPEAPDLLQDFGQDGGPFDRPDAEEFAPPGEVRQHLDARELPEVPDLGDDRSVKFKSLEAAKIMKIEWLVLGCIEAKFCK